MMVPWYSLIMAGLWGAAATVLLTVLMGRLRRSGVELPGSPYTWALLAVVGGVAAGLLAAGVAWLS